MQQDIDSMKRALTYTTQKHGPQMRRSGEEPYVNHCKRVAATYMTMVGQVSLDLNALAAAVLHDVVEDTDATLESLRAEGFTAETVEIVRLLTRDEGMSKEDYLHRLFNSGNVHAMIIKLCDNNDNSQMSFRGVWPHWEDAVVRYAREKIRIIRAIRDYIESHPECGVKL